MAMREAFCQNRDHGLITGDTDPTGYFRYSAGAGRPRKYCSTRCAWWASHNFRQTPGGPMRVERTTERPLSLDMNIGTDGEPFTLADLIPADNYEEDLMHATLPVPLPFVGIHMSLSLRGGDAARTSDGFIVLHDGVDMQVIRDSDGINVTSIVLREANIGNPQALTIMDYIVSSAWTDKVHTWLEALREATMLDGTGLAAEYGRDTPEPIIPPAAAIAPGLN